MLCMGKSLGSICFYFFDLGSTHYFVSQDMAAKLDIHSLEMGPKEEAEGAFERQQVPVIPMIGKLRVQVQGYVDSEDFYVSPLNHVNVLLGAPWFTRLLTILSYPNRVKNLEHRGRSISTHANEKGHSILLTSCEPVKARIEPCT